MSELNIKGQDWDVIIHELLEVEREITEIETNGSTSLFIKKHGKRIEMKNIFNSEEDYIEKTNRFSNKILGVEQDASVTEFLSEGRIKLSDGGSARCHIVMPPAVDSPQVTIAKKSMSLNTLEAIRDKGSFDSKMYDFLIAAVKSNMTIVFSGGTGAGKTTMLEAMTRFFDDNERIGVVEDSPELLLQQPNVTYLHSTLWRPGMSRNDVATLSWCVQQINRQRTDKLIIGESRGGEFADFIIGANSGMEGSMTSIHANNARMALQKMTQFVIIGLPQPVRNANESISRTVDIIVQLGFNKNKKNRTLEIVEVSNTLGNTESAVIATNPLFTYDEPTDSWGQSGNPSDQLRERFEAFGFDPRSFKEKGFSSGTNLTGATNKWRR